MNKKRIDQLFATKQYKNALEQLSQLPSTAWGEATKLRCYRAMGKLKTAAKLSNDLHTQINAEKLLFKASRSELNHLRRYIALVFSEYGQAEDACNILSQLIEQKPQVAALHREHAYALTSLGKLDEAEQELRQALLLQPSNANAHAQLARLCCRTGRIQAGIDGYTRAATLEPNNPEYISRLIYWSNFAASTTQQSNFQLARLWASKAYPNIANNQSTRPIQQNRRIKLGFVSADFCAHPESFFIKPLLSGLDKKKFEIFLFSNSSKKDGVTKQLKQLSDAWVDISRKDTQWFVKSIQNSEIDILVDLNGHASGNRLDVFALAPAPMQVSWLGYPSSTGLKSVGYRITDRSADPVGLSENGYCESLIRLPNGHLCFEPLESAPDVSPSPRPAGIRFGCFSDLSKITSSTLDWWAEVMHAAPQSTIRLKRQQFSDQHTRERIIDDFQQRGISSSRISMDPSLPTIEEHLDAYNKIDIALDTSPFNGMTTTMEALWMGVPVMSLSTPTYAGRIGKSILEQAGLNTFHSEKTSLLAERCGFFAAHLQELDVIKKSLRQQVQRSLLVDSDRFGRDFGQALSFHWQTLCDEQRKRANK